jgi:hypothetical protein
LVDTFNIDRMDFTTLLLEVHQTYMKKKLLNKNSLIIL